jgi:hypothetical protein
MLSASEQTEEKVRNVYSKRPSIVVGPSHISHTRTIHPKRRAKKTYLVAQVTALEELCSRAKPHLYLLPITQGGGNEVMQTREILKDAAERCEKLNEVRRWFKRGWWVDYHDELENALPAQQMTLLDAEVSDYSVFDMNRRSLFTWRTTHLEEDQDVFCRLEGWKDNNLHVRTEEFKQFQATPVASKTLTE